MTRKPSASSGAARPQLRESTIPSCRQTSAGPAPDSSYQRPFAAYGTEPTLASAAMRFEHVLVVGAGQMGGGIAQVVAASGRRVSLHDALPGATDRALTTMEQSLVKLAEKGGA